MKKVSILTGLLLACSVSIAAAQGMNLRLDDCGGFGTVNALANCASNTGPAMTMVGSAIAPAGLNRVVGCEGVIEAVTAAPSLSPWWHFETAGCRQGSLSFGFDFLGGPTNCTDFWGGTALGGGGVSPDHPAPNRLRITLVCGTPDEHPMVDGVEHYLFRVIINRAKSTGVGACAGCTEPACFVLDHLLITQPTGVGDAAITNPIVGNFVMYNGGGGLPGGCPGATPTQNRTWGQVKSLYR